MLYSANIALSPELSQDFQWLASLEIEERTQNIPKLVKRYKLTTRWFWDLYCAWEVESLNSAAAIAFVNEILRLQDLRHDPNFSEHLAELRASRAETDSALQQFLDMSEEELGAWLVGGAA
jgi:hypothetical protein